MRLKNSFVASAHKFYLKKNDEVSLFKNTTTINHYEILVVITFFWDDREGGAVHDRIWFLEHDITDFALNIPLWAQNLGNSRRSI